MTTYTATTALPYAHIDRATMGLRAELRRQLTLGDLADWSTLEVIGPDEVVGLHGRVWYEWTATVKTSRRG